jgi:HD-GYP domain-containing protein (c-di-GMP phosphodiesterase class II)
MYKEEIASYQSDRIWLKVRWPLLFIALFAVFDKSMSNGFMLFTAAQVALGAVAQFLTSKRKPQNFNHTRLITGLRLLDIITVSSISVIASKQFENLWLIAVPIIIFETISSSSLKKTAFVALLASLSTLIPSFIYNKNEIPLVQLVSLILSSVIGYVLAKFQRGENKLKARDRRLTTLMDTATNLASCVDINSLVSTTLKSAVTDLGASAGLVYLINEEDKTHLITEAVYSQQGSFHFPDDLEVGSGFSGYVAKMGQPITLVSELNEILSIDSIELDVLNAVAVPLINNNYTSSGINSSESIIGVITLLFTSNGDSLEAEDLDLLQSLSSLLANAIYNARMEERQRATFLRTLESLAKSLEARDDYTRGHSQRVCDLSGLIGYRLGLMPDALEELRIGTILHDIGKIGVPDAILNKPGRLTSEEFDVMKSHPVIGYNICKPLMLSEGVLMIIRNHHEKLDGSGYPDGLKGGELPLSLRIVCVADAFDAMSSRRPYRGVMDINVVMGEMSKGAGIQFDPVIVEALKELLYSDELNTMYSDFWDNVSQFAHNETTKQVA